MSELFKPGLDMLQPGADWRAAAPANVDVLFTCREGGVSSGPWGDENGVMGLNVGPHTGDFAACVKMNRQIVSQLVPTDPKWLKQVHGTRVVAAETAEGEPEADAAVSMTPGVVAVVMVADCLPVMIADAEGRAVCAVHAGWRGLADGVVQMGVKAVRDAVGDDEARVVVWLGPRIGPEAFEVGEDVREAMKANLPNADAAFREENGKLYADLGMLAREALAQMRVTEADVFDCGLSTHADKKRFWSFRRDGEKAGRHAAMIWLKPEAAEPAQA